jgi:hypothetical protein
MLRQIERAGRGNGNPNEKDASPKQQKRDQQKTRNKFLTCVRAHMKNTSACHTVIRMHCIQ